MLTLIVLLAYLPLVVATVGLYCLLYLIVTHLHSNDN